MTDTKRLRELYEKIPKETIGYRSDHDYYQGGTYVGVGPLRYLKKGETGFKIPVPLVPVPMEQAEYFKKDLCRIEDDDFGDFIIEVHRQIPALLDEIESLRAKVKSPPYFIDEKTGEIKPLNSDKQELDHYKKALEKCKEQRDCLIEPYKGKEYAKFVSGKHINKERIKNLNKELNKILKRSEDD